MGFNRFLTISPIALVALSACKQSPTSVAVTGNIVNGPLSNALVFLDLDDDNDLDANEQSVRTDANGFFSINSSAANYKIVALTDDSTVDTSSGAVLAGVTLTAPKGAGVISPTSTLMEEGGLTNEQVAEVLGLPDGVDPLTFNPFADGVDATKALEVAKISKQITTAISSFASAAEGAGASTKGAFTAALNSVVDVVKVKAEKINDPNAAAADKTIDFTKTADLDSIKAKVADEAEKIVTAEGTTGFSKAALTNLVNDTATSIKNVNDQIGALTDLTSDASKNVFSTLQVLQDQVKNAAIAEKATPGSGSIDFTDAAKVTASAKNKAPTDIKLSTASIAEGSKDLIIGSLSTTDADQTSGFKYEIAKVDGTDHALFSINSKGELVLNSIPDYSKQSSYKLFVTTTDSGGKKFSKEISINVVKETVIDKQNIEEITTSDGDVFYVSDNQWVLVAEINSTFTLIPVKDDPSSSGQLVYDNNRAPKRELNDDDVKLFLGNQPTLNENIASNTIEFAAIKGAGSNGLVNGDVYIVNKNEKLLLVEQSNGSYTLIPVADGAGDAGLKFDDTRKDKISKDLDKAGVEAVIGSTKYLDDNILLQLNVYNDIVQALSSTPTFLGNVDLPDPYGGAAKVSFKVAAVSEFAPGAFIGELSFDDGSSGGDLVLPIYRHSSGGITIFIEDGDGIWQNDPILATGYYAMDKANNRAFEVAKNSDGVYEFTTGTVIPFASGQSYGAKTYVDNPNYFTSLGNITLKASTEEPNIVFAIDGQDLGFTVEGNKVYLNDDSYFNKGSGDKGTLVVDPSSGGGFGLADVSLSIAVSGDVSGNGRIKVLDADGDYFGIDSAKITDGGSFTFTPFNFNSFQLGDELGAITATGFDFDTFELASGQFVEIKGNTVKLKDNVFYDVNTNTFNEKGGGFAFLSDLKEIKVTASKGDIDLVSAPILYSDMATGGLVKQIPYWTGQPVADKILPIDVIGRTEVSDGDDVAAIDTAAATEVADIITAAGLNGPVSDGHIYKTSGNDNYLLAFEGDPGSEIFSLIPVTRADSSSPWGYDANGSLIKDLNLTEVTKKLGTAPVEPNVLGTIIQTNGTATHFASVPFYDGKGLGDGDDIIITFSFVEEDATNFGDAYNGPDPSSDKIWGFTDAQKDDTREALSAFSDVANIYFHEISETDDIVGTFRFGMTDHPLNGNKNAAGWAFTPGGSYANADVWIANYDDTDPDAYAAAHDMSAGTMGALTLLHEIGHALGLKHTFAHPVVDRTLESNTYSLMSYTAPEKGWYNNLDNWAISHTPMLLDVAALQFLYGAQTHNQTNTTYSWDETIPFASTIWDSSGIDTLDFSNFTLGHDISLVDGTSSTITFPEYDYTTKIGWDFGQLPDNLSIAHGAIIENVIGGSGDDKIIGNNEDNVLTGGGGADIFEFNAGFGSDTITDFIVGTDTLRFLDSGSKVITNPGTFTAVASADGEDLVLSIQSDELILEGLGSETFDNSFLELV